MTIYEKREITRKHIKRLADYCTADYLHGKLNADTRKIIITCLKEENNSDLKYSEKVRIFNVYLCNNLCKRVYSEIALNTTFYWYQLAEFYGFIKSRKTVYNFISKYETKSNIDFNTCQLRINFLNSY